MTHYFVSHTSRHSRDEALARSYLWRPGLDTEIERHVKDCNSCQIYSRQPPVAPLHPWESWAGRTWHRIHIDYAGPFEGRMLLIIVDAHIKFIDAHIVSSATTSMKFDTHQTSTDILLYRTTTHHCSRQWGLFHEW